MSNDRIVDLPQMPGGAGELVIERLAAMYGIPALRLSTRFEEQLALRGDDANPRLLYTIGDRMHPSPEGCRVTAVALREALRSYETGWQV